jgi:hypothetical protein
MKRLRILRWFTWSLGIVLSPLSFMSASPWDSLRLSGAVLTFSVGLSIPQSWLKKKTGQSDVAASAGITPETAVLR